MYHKIVLIALIVSNILNLYLDRYAGSSNARLSIYIANGVALGTMVYYLIMKPLEFPKCYKPLKWFMVMFIAYLLIQFYWPNPRFIFNNYVRWFMSLLLLFSFYSFDTKDKWGKLLMQIYIVTFIAECSFKIYYGSAFASVDTLNKRVGGDTASMGLALVAPLIFAFFKNKKGLLLYAVCVIFALFSLRRTSILALLIVVPFIWPILKQNVNKRILFVGFIVAGFFILKAWDFVGARVMRRFFEYSTSTEEMNAYGSGRSMFWRFLYNKYLENEHYLFGNGMGSVFETFYNYWRLPLSHAHNDLLEIGYTFGLTGLALWVTYLVKATLFVWKTNVSKLHKKNFYCAILVYLAVALTSGALLRAEMFPMAMAFPVILRPLKDAVETRMETATTTTLATA